MGRPSRAGPTAVPFPRRRRGRQPVSPFVVPASAQCRPAASAPLGLRDGRGIPGRARVVAKSLENLERRGPAAFPALLGTLCRFPRDAGGACRSAWRHARRGGSFRRTLRPAPGPGQPPRLGRPARPVTRQRPDGAVNGARGNRVRARPVSFPAAALRPDPALRRGPHLGRRPLRVAGGGCQVPLRHAASAHRTRHLPAGAHPRPVGQAA